MASFTQISSAITIGQAYYIQLLNFNTTALTGGFPTKFNQRILCLKRLMRALTWDINDNVNDDTTTSLYELLLKEIAPYNGAGIVVDPNVVIPGNTIIIQTAGNFTQSDRVPFGPTFVLTIGNWATDFYPTYGDNPEVQVFIGNPIDGYQQDESTTPVPTFPGNDITQRLQSLTWTWGVAVSGYYIISGKKPS